MVWGLARRFRIQDVTRRQWTTGLALVACVMLLLVVMQAALPTALAGWHSYDYWRYTQIGRALRADLFSYGRVPLDSVYPLPVELLVFIPLSLLPDWFRIVWVMAPIVSLGVLFRRDAIWWAGFPPLWYAMGDGTIDALLILPMYWLIVNRPVWGALGALALLVKPQLVLLPLVYMLVVWVMRREWQQLGVFWGGALLFSLPAFAIDPLWIVHMAQSLYARSDEMLDSAAPVSSSMWGWLGYGMVGWLVLGAFAVLLVVLLWRTVRKSDKRAAAGALLDLVLFWVLYASSLLLIAPTLKGTREIIVIVLCGLGAAVLTRFFGFGAAWSVLPLVALYFLGRANVRNQEVVAS